MTAGSRTVDIQKRSARLRKLLTFLTISLWALLVLERFSAVTVQLFLHGFGAESWRHWTSQLIGSCPEVFYLLALWQVRKALGAFAHGDLYAPAIVRMLNQVGVMLAAGALINVFVVPAARSAIGEGPGYWIAVDVSGLVLGAVGLSLTVIAQVLQRSAEMQAELDEIF